MSLLAASDLAPHSRVTIQEYFEQCEPNKDLLQQVRVTVPVRPGDGLNTELVKYLALWYRYGPFDTMNDYMGGFIEMTRAHIAKQFLEDYDEKYLLMIDNDMIPPINLPYLLARHDEPVVGGCCVSPAMKGGAQLIFTVPDRTGTYRMPTIRSAKIPREGLIEVGHVGTGAMLIRRDVLESFSWKDGDVPFYVPEDIRRKGAESGTLLVGEDIAFCRQIRAKGFVPKVDLEAHLGHQKLFTWWWPEKCIDPELDSVQVGEDGQVFGL